MDLSSLRSAARARLHKSEPAGAQLPLSALRAKLDAVSGGANWSIAPDGVLGRSLVMDAGTTYTVPLATSSPVVLSGRAQLLPHDWMNGVGELTAAITASAAAGESTELWSARLQAGDGGRPRGQAFRCIVPAATSAISLSLRSTSQPHDRTVTRAIWHEPVLHDPSRAAATGSTTSRGPAGDDASFTTHVTAAAPAPLISVLTPVHDPPLHMLQEAVASVFAQSYNNWELCLVDDGSRDPQIKAELQRYAADEPRVKLIVHDRAHGISGATNSALAAATGGFVALLDHDDTLTPDALQRIADELAADPSLDMVYSDENVVADGAVLERHPKPAWSPEHMRALMYTCHLGVYRRALADDLGGFQTQFDGCQDYDFVLRLMERTDRIAHIPEVLYHWRAHRASTAGGDAKPYAYLAQPGAIAEHLQRSGIGAQVQFAHLPGLHRIVHRVDPELTVNLVLVSNDADALIRAARTYVNQSHPSWRLVVATAEPERLGRSLADAEIPAGRALLVQTPPEPASALCAAADAAAAEQLVLLQTPVLGLTTDWLTRLIGYSDQPGIGAAGPVLLTSDGRITEAGVALPAGIPLYLNYGRPAAAAQPVVYNLIAVSGVLATSRRTYESLGGIRPEFGELALIDYCLRAGECGLRTALVPDARLQAAIDPVNQLSSIWRLRDEWSRSHDRDPYYNPSFRNDRGDFVPR